MAKRWIEPAKRQGRPLLVPERLADALVRGGGFRYLDDTEVRVRVEEREPADDYESMTYAELRRLVSESGVTPAGRTKADLVDALRYERRDMRAR